MKIQKSNEFTKIVSIYTLPIIIINNILGHNSTLINKYDWKDFIAIYIISYIATYEID